MTDPECTCPPEPPSVDRQPGRSLSSGFTWHGPGCPIYEAAQWTPEQRRRINEVVEDNRRARLRAMAKARTAVVG